MSFSFHRNAVELSSSGFAYARVETDDSGNPIDLIYLEANDAYRAMIGLEGVPIEGLSAKIVHPQYAGGLSDWMLSVARVGASGRPQRFTTHLAATRRWVGVGANSPEPFHVLIQLDDVSQEVRKFLLYEDFLNITPVLLCVIDLQGAFIMANDEWTSSLGHDRDTLIGSSIRDYLHPDDMGKTEQVLRDLSEDRVVYNFRNRYRHIDGSYRHLEWRARINGTQVYGAARDVTERVARDKQKQRELDLMNLLFEQTLTGMVIMMLDTPVATGCGTVSSDSVDLLLEGLRVVRANEAFLVQYRATEQEMLGRSVADFFRHDPDAARVEFRTFIERGRVSMEFEGRRSDGSSLWVRGDYTCLYDSEKHIVGLFGMQIDITDRKQAELALERSERMYRLIAEHASDVIWAYNLTERRFTYISPSVIRFIGYTPEELIRLPFCASVHPDDIPSTIRRIRSMVAQFGRQSVRKEPWTIRLRHIHKDGTILHGDATVNFRYAPEGYLEAIGVSRDITSRKADEEKILNLSYRDQLTGLHNRRYLEEQQGIIARDPDSLPLSLVVCDVNGLKLANDVFGHQEGDRLLISCARILSGSAGPGEMVARVGGDEFILLLVRTDRASVERRIGTLRDLMGRDNGGRTPLSVSFGAATTESPVDSLEELFKEAEDAMYRHKLLESSSYKHDVIRLLIRSLYDKGAYEREHSAAVACLCVHLGTSMGLYPSDLEELRLAGMLHDIGKIGIETRVLNKAGPLSEHELVQVQRHPEIGFQILRSVQNFGRIADWVLMHHEQPDGHGYPQRLTDAHIPLESKIIAVANAYDAMTSASGYRERMSHEQACEELIRCSGSQFDRSAVEAFLALPVPRLLSEMREKEVADGTKRDAWPL